MRKLFKSKRTANNGTRPAMVEIIADKVTRLQQMIAGYLNRKTQNWQPDRMKLSLVLFCLLSAAVSLIIIGKAIWYPKPENSMIVRPAKMPKFIGRPEDRAVNQDQFISKREYNRLERFRNYMDSLDGTDAGRQIKDSILSQRPKLMDSLAIVEQLYNKQN